MRLFSAFYTEVFFHFTTVTFIFPKVAYLENHFQCKCFVYSDRQDYTLPQLIFASTVSYQTTRVANCPVLAGTSRI